MNFIFLNSKKLSPKSSNLVLIRAGWQRDCNPRCTYCPLLPKRDTFYSTDGSPMAFIRQLFENIGRFGCICLLLQISRVGPKYAGLGFHHCTYVQLSLASCWWSLFMMVASIRPIKASCWDPFMASHK